MTYRIKMLLGRPDCEVTTQFGGCTSPEDCERKAHALYVIKKVLWVREVTEATSARQRQLL